MEQIYIFDWYALDINYTAHIIGIAKDTNNRTMLLRIYNYNPYCYTRGSDMMLYNTNDLTILKGYNKKTFNSFEDLKNFKKYSVNKTYMSDEDDVCLFLATNNLDYNGWINIHTYKSIQGKKYLEYHVDIKNISKIQELLPMPEFLVVSFDIEVYSSNKGMPQSFIHNDKVFMISLVTNNNITVLIEDPDEEKLLQKFSQEIINLDPDIITGFNIFNFDIKYLLDRLELYLSSFQEMSRLPELIPTTYSKLSWTNASYGSHEFTKPNIPGRMFLDMFQYFKRLNIDRYSLNFISEKFLNESKLDLSNDEMRQLYELGFLDKISDYCIQDSKLVIKLCNKFDVIIDFMERSKIMKCKLEDILTRGEQFKINHQLIFECIKRNVILESTTLHTDLSNGYQGASVFEPVPGLYYNCAILDYQSLYPSIIIANNICPSSYVGTVPIDEQINDMFSSVVIDDTTKHIFRKSPKGILPGLLENILSQRQYTKDLMKSEKDINIKNILDKRQNSLKIVANSVYGIMGAKYSKYMKHKYCAESISGYGRYYFDKLITFIKSQELDVIYGDTDSCIISYPQSWDDHKCITISKDLCMNYSKLLPEPMFLNYENFYDKMIIISKKKYIMYRHTNISFKGITSAKRGYCDFVKDVYKILLDMILTSKTKLQIAKYIIKCIDDLLDGNIDPNKLIISKSAKHPNMYKSNVPQKIMLQRLMDEGEEEIYTGIRLDYVFVEHEDKRLKQGYKMFRLDEVIKRNLKIDYKYYVKYQLMNTVDQLLIFADIYDLVKHYYVDRCT